MMTRVLGALLLAGVLAGCARTTAKVSYPDGGAWEYSEARWFLDQSGATVRITDPLRGYSMEASIGYLVRPEGQSSVQETLRRVAHYGLLIYGLTRGVDLSALPPLIGSWFTRTPATPAPGTPVPAAAGAPRWRLWR